MSRKQKIPAPIPELRGRAEARLRERRGNQPSARALQPAADPRQLVHELQVHQVELEMQNEELQKARDHLEALLEKYTDLYDFAPVGYFSLDDQGRILEVNLAGAALLGVERSRLLNQRFPRFVDPSSRPRCLAFLEQVFAGTDKQVCEAMLIKTGATTPFCASLHAISALSVSAPQKWCRVSVSDITSLKQAEAAQRDLETLSVANRELTEEIARRQVVETALKRSEQQKTRLLEQSHLMQQQLRFLSHKILFAQEEERKRISRDLHDVVVQTLTSINLRLATLKADAATTGNTTNLAQHITLTQQLVEHSVNLVHRFARELRPTVLDDLGLIPALHTFMKNFKQETGIHVSLSAFAEVEKADINKRTVLFRVAQEALKNAARHAGASHVEVRIQKLHHVISMMIIDNGQGFLPERVLHAKKNKRLGLLGMRERLEMVGGNIAIESSPGKGTTIQARIPFADDTRGGGA